MVIQDDVTPTRYFMTQTLAAIKERPRNVLNLFCSRWRDMQLALEVNAGWIEYDTICFGQAVVMPTDFVHEFIHWADAKTSADWKMDDQRIAYWACLFGRRIYCTVPSLMQHAKELPSTWAKRDGTTLQAYQVGDWWPDRTTFRPHQRGTKSFLETKARWLVAS